MSRMRALLTSSLGPFGGTLIAIATACAPNVRPGTVVPVTGKPVPGAPAGVTAFVDVSVVPMDRERVLSHQTVLVEGGRITTLGPVAEVPVPTGATRIEGRGQFLLPGLTDMHAHVNGQTIKGLSPEDKLLLWVANGATTIRNMDFYDRDSSILRWRAMAAAGQADYPRIYTAGAWMPPNVTVPPGGSLPSRVADIIAGYKAAGYDFVKIHNQDKNQEILDSVLAVAKRIGIPVAGHVPLPLPIEHILPLGYKSIEHSLLDFWTNRKVARHEHIQEYVSAEEMRDTAGIRTLISGMHKAGIWHCPTQTLFERLASWEPNRWYANAHDTYGAYWYTNRPNLLKIELDSGINLLAGTDQPPWRGVLAREIEAFVHVGLTPYQALRTATYNPSAYFGTLAEVGTIAAGKRADLVLLPGNPLRDVRYTAQPTGVMLGGRWLPRAELDRRIAHLAVVPRAWTPSPSDNMSQRSFTRYWANAADEFEAPASVMIGDQDAALVTKYVTSTQSLRAAFITEQLTKLRHLRAIQHTRQQAFVDSLGESDAYTANTARIVVLVSRELDEVRGVLPPDQRAKFEAQVAVWAAARRASNYSVAVPQIP